MHIGPNLAEDRSAVGFFGYGNEHHPHPRAPPRLSIKARIFELLRDCEFTMNGRSREIITVWYCTVHADSSLEMTKQLRMFQTTQRDLSGSVTALHLSQDRMWRSWFSLCLFRQRTDRWTHQRHSIRADTSAFNCSPAPVLGPPFLKTYFNTSPLCFEDGGNWLHRNICTFLHTPTEIIHLHICYIVITSGPSPAVL